MSVKCYQFPLTVNVKYSHWLMLYFYQLQSITAHPILVESLNKLCSHQLNKTPTGKTVSLELDTRNTQ